MVRGALILVFMVTATIVDFPGVRALGDQINRMVYNNNGLGTYSFEFETSDGTYRKEDGGLIPKPEGESLVVRGEYGYTDPSGRFYFVKYIADENGFQPQPSSSSSAGKRPLLDIGLPRGTPHRPVPSQPYEDVRFNDRKIY